LRRIGRFFVVALIGGIALGVCLAALVPSVRVLATSQTFTGRIQLAALPQRTTVYGADGKSVIGQLGLEDRSVADLKEIPKVVVNAIVAMEDKTFWDNPGVDFEGTTRALLKNLSSGRLAQGGSTITQQLVKNRILTPKRDVQRKLREMILAVRLNNQYSKQQILREYLNTVYFGEGSYGIKSAAERFFGKSVTDLTLPEASMLAAVISSPTYYDPFLNPAHAKQRRSTVLHRMVDQKYITRAEADAAGATPLPAGKPASGGLRPDNYFVQEVQDRLLSDERLGSTPQERYTKVLRGGLKVYTTFDPRMYFLAQTAVNQEGPHRPPFTAALASMDPQSGEVKAIVGGCGLDQCKYNLATHPPGRQPGSTYKVITLAAAIESGYSLNDVVDGTSPCSVKSQYGNYPNARNAEEGGGVLTLRAALAGSVNCAFVRLIASLGPDKVAKMAVRLGIRNEPPHLLSITLGTAEATPLEMATVMSTLADDGVRHDPIFIRKVVGPTGELVFDNKSQGQRVIDPQVARTVIDAMRGVITGGTASRNGHLADGRVAAGKTGTTDSKANAWFDGFTPQLVAVVWMGDPALNTSMAGALGGNAFGGGLPTRIWKAFMDGALQGQPKLDFVPPDRSKWPASRAVLPGKGRGSIALLPTTTTVDPNATTTTVPGVTTTTVPGASTTAAPTTAAPTTAAPTTAAPTTVPPTTAPPTTTAALPVP